MNDFSNRLSISAERPVDALTLQILKLLDGLLRREGIPYMLVGATARDLLLHHVYGHAVTRATYDLDYAILVDSWNQFNEVKHLILTMEGFTDKGRNPQRLYYRPPHAKFDAIIDAIPFGKLEQPDRTIAWPPDADIVMNVAAFTDVFASSIVIEVEPGLSIPVPSLAGLVILKLFAWLDRRDAKDVQDIRRLLETYTDAGNLDRLYDEKANELELLGFDTVLAGAYLLGEDAQRISDPQLLTNLRKVLHRETATELVHQVSRTMSILEDRTQASSALLGCFFRGMGLDNLL
jgi:predicted nucleotidyltransferase